MLNKFSFYFDFRKLKAVLPYSWTQKTTCKSGDINPNNLLDMLYDIPGVGRGALGDFSMKDI